eukprot:TRINITY_DN39215_c0_g1_i1.p1 TRINITY_DN39215_c0_g1~~TRINITY_DN39215_c0_g1_i1.p1  ORF type:complete len:154 (-),score=26.50 TRINITY_DN39215_c0_g1_i1:527-988(-)
MALRVLPSLPSTQPTVSTGSIFGTRFAIPSAPPPALFRVSGPLQVEAAKKLQGTVVSNSRDKTVAVEVKRITTHPLYKKRMIRSKKYHVHDPENQCNIGDWVTLAKCAPVSKTKTFIVADIRRARVAGASRHSGDTDDEEEAELDLPLQSQVA